MVMKLRGLFCYLLVLGLVFLFPTSIKASEIEWRYEFDGQVITDQLWAWDLIQDDSIRLPARVETNERPVFNRREYYIEEFLNQNYFLGF